MIHDSPPSGDLASLVEGFRFITRREGRPHPEIELQPDCHFGITFLVGDTICGAMLGGPFLAPYAYTPWAKASYACINFRPGRLPRLVDVQARELRDRAVHGMPRLFGLPVEDICAQLAAAGSPDGQQAVLERLLRPVLARPLCQDRRCIRALELIEAGSGRSRVQDVAEAFGMSPRSLQRVFLDQVGLAPKQFIRHLRLQKALGMLRERAFPARMADLALVCGYSDQSHLIREFTALTHRSPGTFLGHPRTA